MNAPQPDDPEDQRGSVRARLGPVGVWTAAVDGLTVDDVGGFARTVEEAGATGIWFGEAYGREAFAQAGLLLSGTRQLIVGSSIANIYGRDALAARGAQATLGALYPGRFVMGLGVSHAPLVERMRGHDYRGPLGAMRGYLEAMDGVQPVVADAAPARPRMLAALGPKMLALSAELADGALPYLTLPEHTATARDIIGPDRILVVEQAVTLIEDDEEAQRRAHVHLEIYTGLRNYRASWQRQGFADDDFVRGGSQRLKDAMVVRGVDAGLARVQEHLDAGADQVAVQMIGSQPLDPAIEHLRTFLTAAGRRWTTGA